MSSGPPKAVDYRRFEGQEKVCEQALEVLYTIHTNGAPPYSHDCKVEGYLIGGFREEPFSATWWIEAPHLHRTQPNRKKL
jgi:hypothetical protein